MPVRILSACLFWLAMSNLFAQGFDEGEQAYFGERIPSDLINVLLSSPDVLRREDLPKFKEWREVLKRGEQGLVRLKNPAYNQRRFSYWGIVVPELSPAEDPGKTCAEIKVSYYWSIIYRSQIEQLLNVANNLMQDLDSASDEEFDLYLTTFKEVLSHLRSSIQKFIFNISKVQSSDQSVPIHYTWPVSKPDFVQSIYPTSNARVQAVTVNELRYPGQNWSAASGYPIEDHAFVVRQLDYLSGALRMTVRESLSEFCLNQYYFGVDAEVKVNFEVLNSSNQMIRVDTQTTPIRLAGLKMETFSNELVESHELLKTVNEKVHQFAQAREAGLRSESYLLLMLSELMHEECQQNLHKISAGTFTGCQRLESKLPTMKNHYWQDVQDIKIALSAVENHEGKEIFERWWREGRWLEALILAEKMQPTL